jgi:hypothetical protein
MMMFGGPELEEQLRPWLGKEIEDAELADVFRTKYESFNIGELCEEEEDAGAGEYITAFLGRTG